MYHPFMTFQREDATMCRVAVRRDDATTLAKGIRAALDQAPSKRAAK